MANIKEKFSASSSWVIGEKNIIQKDFARICGISPSSLTDYKTGRREGNENARAKIAKRLGYEYQDFLLPGQWILDGNDGADWRADQAGARQSDDSAPAMPPPDHVEIIRLLELRIADKDKMLAEKDKYLADKDKIIELQDAMLLAERGNAPVPTQPAHSGRSAAHLSPPNTNEDAP